MRRIRVKSILAAVCLAAGASEPSSALVIDDFETGAQSLSADSIADASGVAAGAGMVGGERDVILNQTSGSGEVDLTVDALDDGLLVVDAESGTTGAAAVFWDGVDGNPFGGQNLVLGLDLTAGGANALVIHVVSNASEATVQFNLYTTQTDTVSLLAVIPGGIVAPTTVTLLFSGASTIGEGDLSDVNAIEMDLQPSGEAGLDLALELVETATVPEPAAGLLLLAAGACARRRAGAGRAARGRRGIPRSVPGASRWPHGSLA
jgi:hypothetical protein